jgi:hypothetical protein
MFHGCRPFEWKTPGLAGFATVADRQRLAIGDATTKLLEKW